MTTYAALFAAALFLVPVSATADAVAPVRKILADADRAPRDRAVQEKALADLDALITTDPKAPVAHLARGMMLSRLGRAADALAAYDTASGLDPKLADAWYNAGTILGGMGRDAEALTHFEAALKADPKHIDAAYNAGQAYYNRKDFAHALERFRTALDLAPDDFDIAKKVMQCDFALGKDADAARDRQRVVALWTASKDPGVKRQRDVVFDQFDLAGAHIMAAENLQPEGDLYSLYVFRVLDAKGKPIGTVQLESTAYGRETGMPYLLGWTRGGLHGTAGPGYAAAPTYRELRSRAEELIRQKLLTP